MAYEYPNNFTSGNTTTSVTGVGSLLAYGNYVLNGWLGTGFLLIIFMLVMVSTGINNMVKSFTAASFITFIFAIYFVRIQMANPVLPFILLVMTIVGFLLSKDQQGI